MSPQCDARSPDGCLNPAISREPDDRTPGFPDTPVQRVRCAGESGTKAPSVSITIAIFVYDRERWHESSHSICREGWHLRHPFHNPRGQTKVDNVPGEFFRSDQGDVFLIDRQSIRCSMVNNKST